MRIVMVALLFIISVLIRLEPVSAREPLSKEDSVIVAQREKAIAEFNSGFFRVSMSWAKCNAYYAEEALYKLCGVKAEIWEFPIMCGTDMEDYFFERECYDAIIDSLMFKAYGRDIYQRMNAEGSDIELHFPDRYPEEGDPVCGKQPYNLDSVNAILVQHIKYPLSARNDTIQGVVYVWAEYDSTGAVVRTSIAKSVREDLDSAAMEGVRHIGKVNPDFRWGICRPGKVVVPVRFKLEE